MKLHITSPQYSPIRKDWLKQVVFGLSNTYKHANILIAKRIERFQLMTSQEKDTCSSILPKIFCTLQNVFPQLPNVYTHWDNWPLYDWNNKFELSRDKNKRFKNLKIFWYFASRLICICSTTLRRSSRTCRPKFSASREAQSQRIRLLLWNLKNMERKIRWTMTHLFTLCSHHGFYPQAELMCWVRDIWRSFQIRFNNAITLRPWCMHYAFLLKKNYKYIYIYI